MILKYSIEGEDMKKIVIFILSCMFMALATPHYPNGIPNIGPLKGGPTFWGQDKDGNYFDGVRYGYSNKINSSKYGSIELSINYTKYLNSMLKKMENKKSISISFKEPVKKMTGEIIIKSLNSDGKIIVRNYNGTVNNEKRIIYDSFFDFSGITEKSEVTMEFLLENGEKLSVKIDGQILKDLISLSEHFPESKNIQGK